MTVIVSYDEIKKETNVSWFPQNYRS